MNDDKEDIYKIEDDDDVNYTERKEAKEDLGKKLIRYGIIIFVALIILIILIAIFFPKGNSKKDETVTKAVTLNTGDKYALGYSKGTYSWTSSNQSIAKVSSDGEIIGIKNGDATITVKVGSETVTYKVHVDKVDEAVVLTNIKMEKNTIELDKGKSYKMKVTLTPSNATNTELTWSSSNEKVAIVKDGEIKALAPGISMITVKSTNGNTDNCLVKVVGDGKYNPVESIKIDSKDVSLNKGTSYNLSYEVTPSDSANLVTWESSDPNVANVENGVVYALTGGEITIYAKSGDVTESVKVIVVEEKKEEQVEFMLNQTEISMTVGDTYTLGTNDSSIQVTWISSNINIASIDQSGVVTANSPGETVVTAKASNGYFYDCKVTVIAKEEEKPTPVEKETISLNSSIVSMNVGDKIRLIETVYPTNNVSSVTWESSDPTVATVTNGEITAVKNGTTTITAKLPNGEKAECVVNVSTKVINASLVTINATKVTLTVGGTTVLSATILPSNATNKTITWSSSNPSVATVDQNGKVTAVSSGTAKIYAKTDNGVFDSCGVIVNK